MTRRLVMTAWMVIGFASIAAAQNQRAWIDVNFGIAQPAEDSLRTLAERSLFFETASTQVDYRFSRGANFDFGGGYLFTPNIGIGVNVVGTAHQDPAALMIRVPHPNFFNRTATDTADTEGDLERTEGVINLQVVGVPLHSNRLQVRLFGGPSYFRLKGDAISQVRWNQVFLGAANAVDITTYDTETIEETGWGFHLGGDVGVFFTRVVGIGGFVRFSRGTVTVEDDRVLSDEAIDVKVGGFQAGGGLRLRF